MVNLPYKSDVYEEKMLIDRYKSLNKVYIKKLYENIDKNKIKTIDIQNVFSNKEELYYKIDHYWNMDRTWKA